MKNMSMKKMMYLMAIFVILGGLYYFTQNLKSVPTDKENPIASEVTDMSRIVDDLDEVIKEVIAKRTNEDVIILDVRTDGEWDASHIEGAVHHGLAKHLKKGSLPEIDKDKEIYVYCKSGYRAIESIRILKEAGYTNLTNIRGLEDWIRNDGPTSTMASESNLQ